MATDDAILDYVFDPTAERPATAGEQRPRHHFDLRPRPAHLDDARIATLVAREREGVLLAEQTQLDAALALFSQIIADEPTYASAYNNRAQVQQLRGDVDAALRDADVAVAAAFDELTLRQAFTQRAMLHRLAGRDDEAYKDFDAAASLGSHLAKVEAAKLNPYAKMCNAMLNEVFKAYYQPPPAAS